MPPGPTQICKGQKAAGERKALKARASHEGVVGAPLAEPVILWEEKPPVDMEIESSYDPRTCNDSSDTDDNKWNNDQASLLLGSCDSHQAIMFTARVKFLPWVHLGDSGSLRFSLGIKPY